MACLGAFLFAWVVGYAICRAVLGAAWRDVPLPLRLGVWLGGRRGVQRDDHVLGHRPGPDISRRGGRRHRRGDAWLLSCPIDPATGRTGAASRTRSVEGACGPLAGCRSLRGGSGHLAGPRSRHWSNRSRRWLGCVFDLEPTSAVLLPVSRGVDAGVRPRPGILRTRSTPTSCPA